jgi:hypothetical protein
MEQMSREEIFTALEEMGAVKAMVYFSGGHDEGGADRIEIVLGDGERKEIYEYKFDGKEQTEEEIRLAVSLAAPVYKEYGSFAGEFSVSGDIEWNVPDRKAYMSGEEQDWHPFGTREV